MVLPIAHDGTKKRKERSMDEQVVIKLPADKKTQLSAIAEKMGLNLSGYIRMILYREIDAIEN